MADLLCTSCRRVINNIKLYPPDQHEENLLHEDINNNQMNDMEMQTGERLFSMINSKNSKKCHVFYA